ncbi:unnamed protein product [Ambrosiozyma monospora]|uniref:Unnamed protein product n=1 Tax=Ambrosiozyma monospora TaxID=43982 RepID=A0ACB5STJ2_AMBMO|nr:unnamed protein product [Ambrosiozyma monospora]
MFWPISISNQFKLPEVKPLEKSAKPSKANLHNLKYALPQPNEDPIIATTSNSTNPQNNLPYIAITYRGLYLFDCRTDSPLAAHIRSDLSIKSHGENQSVKLSPNGKTIAILTTGNDIMVYTIRVAKDDELLTIFNKDGRIIQNGLPILSPDYKDTDFLVSTGSSTRSKGKHARTASSAIAGEVDGISGSGVFESEGFVNKFISVLLSDDSKETPNYDIGLRLKLIVNVQSHIMDYCFLDNLSLLLTHSKPHAFQVIYLNDPQRAANTEAKGQHFIGFDEFPWLTSSKTSDPGSVVVKSVYYSYEMNCFVLISNAGECWLVYKVDDGSGKLDFKEFMLHWFEEWKFFDIQDEKRPFRCQIEEYKDS